MCDELVKKREREGERERGRRRERERDTNILNDIHIPQFPYSPVVLIMNSKSCP